MQTTLELPESILRRTEQAARARGVSVDTLVSDVLEREFLGETQAAPALHHVSLPIIHSKNPGTLDLSNFDLDDLLV